VPRLVAALLLSPAAALGQPQAAADGLSQAPAIEALGDRAAGQARPYYQGAIEAWERIAQLAKPLGDDALVERTLEARAALAVQAADAALLPWPAGAAAVRVWPLAMSKPLDAAQRAGIEKLSRLLAVASRRYPRVAASEPRDLPLVLEAKALADRVLGDSSQVEADSYWRQALARAGRDANAAALRVRLQLKLRDHEGARETIRASRAQLASLGTEERVAHLRDVETLAAFGARKDELLAARDGIRALGGKAEGQARVYARLASVPIGARADLVATAAAFAGLLGGFDLGLRERALCGLFAGWSAVDLGEYGLAAEFLRKASQAAQAVPPPARDPWLEAAVLGRLAFALDRVGDYEGALSALGGAERRLGELRGVEAFRSRLDLNAARLLLELGKPHDAERRARAVLGDSAVAAPLRLRSRLAVAEALYERARAEPALLPDTLAACRRAEKDLAGLGGDEEAQDELAVTIDVQTANILRRQAHASRSSEERAALLAEAIDRQDRALRRASEAQLYSLAAVAAANLGELFIESGRLDAARRFVDWALERARERREFEIEWRCRWYLGRLALAEAASRAGDPAAPQAAAAFAAQEFEAAARIIESYRARILGAEAKAGFLTDKMDLYADLARLEVERGRTVQAFEVAERARARALVESLGWRFVALASPEETALYREYVSLQGQAATLRGAGKAFLGVETREQDHEALRSRLESLRKLLTSSTEVRPALRALADGAPATAVEVQQSLDGETTLVEYFDAGEALLAFVVERQRLRAVRLAASGRDLRAQVKSFVEGGAADAALARKLYTLLVEPLGLDRPRLVIVPHGALHQLPFEALRSADGCLVERFEIAYLPSASLLRYLRSSGASGRTAGPRGLELLALVDPDTDYDGDGRRDLVELPHARKEVEAFAASFAAREVRSGREASEASLADLARGKHVIHLACHGEFYPSRPWDSALFLARGGDDADRDGRLRASEVYRMDLRGNHLVALSGCETGRNDVGLGEDPVGMATAFLHAGAGALLVSLWKVEDEATAALMKAFYRRWLGDGKSRAAAFREAKLELLRGGFAQPRQWAAFVLVGSG
jgi:CHAT domain-containing protein